MKYVLYMTKSIEIWKREINNYMEVTGEHRNWRIGYAFSSSEELETSFYDIHTHSLGDMVKLEESLPNLRKE